MKLKYIKVALVALIYSAMLGACESVFNKENVRLVAGLTAAASGVTFLYFKKLKNDHLRNLEEKQKRALLALGRSTILDCLQITKNQVYKTYEKHMTTPVVNAVQGDHKVSGDLVPFDAGRHEEWENEKMRCIESDLVRFDLDKEALRDFRLIPANSAPSKRIIEDLVITEKQAAVFCGINDCRFGGGPRVSEDDREINAAAQLEILQTLMRLKRSASNNNQRSQQEMQDFVEQTLSLEEVTSSLRALSTTLNNNEKVLEIAPLRGIVIGRDSAEQFFPQQQESDDVPEKQKGWLAFLSSWGTKVAQPAQQEKSDATAFLNTICQPRGYFGFIPQWRVSEPTPEAEFRTAVKTYYKQDNVDAFFVLKAACDNYQHYAWTRILGKEWSDAFHRGLEQEEVERATILLGYQAIAGMYGIAGAVGFLVTYAFGR